MFTSEEQNELNRLLEIIGTVESETEWKPAAKRAREIHHIASSREEEFGRLSNE